MFCFWVATTAVTPGRLGQRGAELLYWSRAVWGDGDASGLGGGNGCPAVQMYSMAINSTHNEPFNAKLHVCPITIFLKGKFLNTDTKRSGKRGVEWRQLRCKCSPASRYPGTSRCEGCLSEEESGLRMVPEEQCSSPQEGVCSYLKMRLKIPNPV